VAAGFGIEITEGLVNLGAYDVGSRPVCIFGGINRRVFELFLENRIHILAMMFQFQEPGHMVNSGDPVVELIDRDTDVFRQFGGGALHAVAQADIFNFGCNR